jgi:PPOX class probable FMN-dependent enzyme
MRAKLEPQHGRRAPCDPATYSESPQTGRAPPSVTSPVVVRGSADSRRRACILAAAMAGTIRDEGELRALLGSPAEPVLGKIADRLNDLTRQFVERSPFVCVATARPDGGLDVSPRGDPAGFVRILDERTLLLPERPGNRIADTLTNLLADPRIALLFLVPGVGDTFRVNGTAAVVDDPDLLAPSAVDGNAPQLGILVSIDEAYTQCPKALIRSDLWNAERHVDRSDLPSSGEILRSLGDPAFDAAEYDRARAERYARREGLY